MPIAAPASPEAWSVIPGLATIILAKTFNLILGYADGVYRDCLYFAKDRLRTPELKLEMVLCISLCRLDRYFMAPFAVLD
eukprot:s8395_g2.t1